MLNKHLNAQVSDATKVDNSNTAGYIMIISDQHVATLL